MQKKKRLRAFIVIASLLVTITAGYAAYAAEAGTKDDPIISLSFLNNVFKPEILSLVDQKVADAGAGTETDARIFRPLEVASGKTIICAEGTEIILRSGKAVSICPGENGLVDATGGLDLAGNNEVVKNHVYIIPRADGRGIKMTVEGFVMIKGGYTIK